MGVTQITRTSWSDVTLAEYAAAELLAHPDPESTLNAVWDEIHEHNPFRGDKPSRLTDDGRAWLDRMRETYTTTMDERERIGCAREVVSSLGTLIVTAARRRIRSGGTSQPEGL